MVNALSYLPKPFLSDERGAVTVDWTVLAAAAVGLSLATAASLNGTLDAVFSRVDHELRSQQISDDFVQFTSAHFERLYAQGTLDPETAQALFASANTMLNKDLLTMLEWGIAQLQAGTMPQSDLAALYAAASVAYQRNVVPDDILQSYFGFHPGT